MLKLEKRRSRVIAAAAAIAGTVAAGALIFAVLFSGQKNVPAVQAEEPGPVSYWRDETPPYSPFVSQQLKDAWEKNNDVVGWLTVDGCEIDNRVFQAEDNDYYLRKDEDGNHDVWGCYFLDCENRTDGASFEDRVLIIYGHSLKNDPDNQKFSKLKRYKDAQFAAAHPVIEFTSLTGTYRWEVFAASDIPVAMYYNVPRPSDKKFAKIMTYLQEHSKVDFGCTAGPDDQVLLLSTCTSDPDVRYVVAAKLITEEGTDN